MAFGWPGNIRQLANEMARAALFLDAGELLDTARLSEEIRAAPTACGTRSLAEVLEAVERDEIAMALEACGGNADEAAERLGVSRATLYRRLKALGI
jgi:transcriptional regulator of acetoin/glycerol metabolism